MIKKTCKYISGLLVALILISACAFLCFQFLIGLLTEAEKRNTIVSTSYAVYEFDPNKILDSLESGSDVFDKTGEGEEFYNERINPVETIPPIQWTQEDFMNVANEAVLQFTGESLTDWKLNNIFFRMQCVNADLGPQRMNLTFFKTGPAQGERSELNVSVLPRSGQVDLQELFYSPYTLGEGYVSFEQIKIPVEVAFALAEENGGYSARQFINNDCEVRISFVASATNDYWDIIYLQNSTRLFQIFVDEETGKYKNVKSP